MLRKLEYLRLKTKTPMKIPMENSSIVSAKKCVHNHMALELKMLYSKKNNARLKLS